MINFVDEISLFFTYANIQHVKSNYFLGINKYWSASVFQYLTDDNTIIMDFYPVACDLKCEKFTAAIFL